LHEKVLSLLQQRAEKHNMMIECLGLKFQRDKKGINLKIAVDKSKKV